MLTWRDFNIDLQIPFSAEEIIAVFQVFDVLIEVIWELKKKKDTNA